VTQQDRAKVQAVQVKARGERINHVWTEITACADLVAVPERRAYRVPLNSDP